MDVIPIFLMHEQEDRLTLKGHREAFDFYLEQKAKGKILAVGFSTHRVAAVDYAPRYPGVDVVFPLINVTGVGIPDGTRDEMAEAIRRAHLGNIGIYAMKPLGGGHLIADPKQAFDYLRGLGTIDTICVGVQNEDEIDVNLRLVVGEEPDAEALARTEARAPPPDDSRLLPWLRSMRSPLPSGPFTSKTASASATSRNAFAAATAPRSAKNSASK